MVANSIASRQHPPRRGRPHDFAAAPCSFQSKHWRGKRWNQFASSALAEACDARGTILAAKLAKTFEVREIATYSFLRSSGGPIEPSGVAPMQIFED